MKKLYTFTFAFLSLNFLFAQEKTDKLLVDILSKQPDKFGNILKNGKDLRVQIIYTQINRDAQNRPSFKSYNYRVNKDEYFYPASTVKFPASLLALEKLNGLRINGLDKHSPMLTDSCEGIPNYPPQYLDDTKADNIPSVAHYIKKILMVSDNDAHNRLYEFMGQELFNKNLYLKGYKNVRIVHRLQNPMSREQNRRSNPIRFYNTSAKQAESIDTVTQIDPISYVTKTKIIVNKGFDNKDLVYAQPTLTSATWFEAPEKIGVGKGFMRNDQVVNEPFDFTTKNYYALEDQQAVLRAALFPESVAPEKRFNLTDDDYRFVWKYMSQLPTESTYPPYGKDTAMYDSYCKFLMFGDNKKPMPKNIRIFNKVGDAYGFLLDNAYIVDFDKGVEFMLSAIIYCNSDGIFNDDKYDYDKVGYPFMANLGKVIYEYESKRVKKIKPDLSKFKFEYDLKR
jgi:Beta-lactamase enzyme family